ncbi:hypothetical protein OGAPHI_007359 [Ogataea philodendri]|uniref:Uncharacterized protein n=1 Tax=Ogataea philodendri TaxID=1378263 RepID=A0A9P8SZJ1_9ASCO|nr:uncharacterized protein OGAPHI_007359 [Ogataea philodendri]KAH3660154.1 hypothetical protein OGAPHI_007359 [Ogataea philodendri]
MGFLEAIPTPQGTKKGRRNDILGVILGELLNVLNSEFRLEQELLVVREFNNERNVKNVLQPLGERERDHVTQVHRVGRRTTAGVQEKRFAVLVQVQDSVKVSFRKEQAFLEEMVWLVAGHLCESLQSLLGNSFGTKLGDQFLVIDADGLAVHNGSLDLPWSDLLFGLFGRSDRQFFSAIDKLAHVDFFLIFYNRK